MASFTMIFEKPFIGKTSLAGNALTTDLALYPAANFPVLGGQYFPRIGKKLKIRLFVDERRARSGNLVFDIYYGTGGAANGTLLHPRFHDRLVASKTIFPDAGNHRALSFYRSDGTLFWHRVCTDEVGLVLSTAQPILIPDSAAVVSGAVI